MLEFFRRENSFKKEIRNHFILHPKDEIYLLAEDVPETIKISIFGSKENHQIEGVERNYDFFTPLEMGKKWLFERTLKYQPKLAMQLLQGSELFVIKKHMNYELAPHQYTLSLIMEYKSLYISLHRQFHGRNLSDESYKARLGVIERSSVLPEEIKQAYYFNFDGFKALKANSTGDIYPWLFPASTKQWETIDSYLSRLRLKKRYLPWLEDHFPGEMGKSPKMNKKDDLWLGLMSFLDTRVDRSKKEGDVFFVKTFVNDKLIYHVRNGDIENMRILVDYQEAIDNYCEQRFLGNKEEFDFLPYTQDFI